MMFQHPATSAAAARLRGQGGCGGRAQHAAAAVPGGQEDLGGLGLWDLLCQRRHLRLLGILRQHRHLHQLPPGQGDKAATGVETVSVVMIRAGVLAAADPQQRGGLGHGAGRREDVPQDVPEEQELPQEEDQGIAIVTCNLGVLHRYCIIGS